MFAVAIASRRSAVDILGWTRVLFSTVVGDGGNAALRTTNRLLKLHVAAVRLRRGVSPLFGIRQAESWARPLLAMGSFARAAAGGSQIAARVCTILSPLRPLVLRPPER